MQKKCIYIFTTGFAYVGGACVVNKRLEKVNSVAIIEDTGGFSGIIVAAHEVGHLWVTYQHIYMDEKMLFKIKFT